MSRRAIALSFLISAVFIALGAMLFQRGDAAVSTGDFESGISITPSAEATPSFTSSNDLVLQRLTEIDARLSGIEHQLAATRGGVLNTSPPPISITPHAAAIAQRKLTSMFPDHRIDQNGMLGYQIELSKLPAEEQLALGVAMTQAINAGRIKFRLDQ